MKALGCLEAIKEVDLSNADHETNPSVLLETRDGYTVKLGDCRSSDPEVNRIHAKLRSFMLVRDRMNSLSQAERESIENRIGQSISGGSIDVTTPESPYFSPGSAQ